MDSAGNNTSMPSAACAPPVSSQIPVKSSTKNKTKKKTSCEKPPKTHKTRMNNNQMLLLPSIMAFCLGWLICEYTHKNNSFSSEIIMQNNSHADNSASFWIFLSETMLEGFTNNKAVLFQWLPLMTFVSYLILTVQKENPTLLDGYIIHIPWYTIFGSVVGILFFREYANFFTSMSIGCGVLSFLSFWEILSSNQNYWRAISLTWSTKECSLEVLTYWKKSVKHEIEITKAIDVLLLIAIIPTTVFYKEVLTFIVVFVASVKYITGFRCFCFVK